MTETLQEDNADPDPVRQFAAWFEQAGRAGVAAPEAAAVATAGTDGAPSVRMVLVKRADEHGFVFYTNYASRKGRELADNPRAALMFYWEPLGRSVRIEGAVQRTPREETEAYVRSRARGSRLSALASPQSQVIEDRTLLERRVAELDERHPGDELPIADGWGGFRIVPESIEFWQQRDSRLHDRLRYRRGPDGAWLIERLAP
jgi:pyridoxamine 5'-phosphate oxidase